MVQSFCARCAGTLKIPTAKILDSDNQILHQQIIVLLFTQNAGDISLGFRYSIDYVVLLRLFALDRDICRKLFAFATKLKGRSSTRCCFHFETDYSSYKLENNEHRDVVHRRNIWCRLLHI